MLVNERGRAKPDAPRQTHLHALAARLSGPGGYYNLGNALGLTMGMFLQIRLALDNDEVGLFASLGAAGEYLAGGWSAVALTVATLIFFWSGEEYHRAWASELPDAAGIRRGDFLSGIGSLALGVSLLLIGDPLLAATSGLLHAAGKFGSTLKFGAERTMLFGIRISELCRISVLISRIPAIIVALIAIARVGGRAEMVHELAMPATLLACYLLWARADITLLRK
jgi:hypothetical protein